MLQDTSADANKWCFRWKHQCCGVREDTHYTGKWETLLRNTNEDLWVKVRPICLRHIQNMYLNSDTYKIRNVYGINKKQI